MFSILKRKMVSQLIGIGMLVIPLGIGDSLIKADEIENPAFAKWSDFEVGSKVIYETETVSKSLKTLERKEISIKKKDATVIVLENSIQTIVGDQKWEGSEKRVDTFEIKKTFRLPKGVDKKGFLEPKGVLESGEARVELAGRVYETKWTKTKNRVEAGDTFTTTWSSSKVPGGLVKSTSETPAADSVTVIQLLEVVIPN